MAPPSQDTQRFINHSLMDLYMAPLSQETERFLIDTGLDEYVQNFKQKGYNDIFKLLTLNRTERKYLFCDVGIYDTHERYKFKQALRIMTRIGVKPQFTPVEYDHFLPRGCLFARTKSNVPHHPKYKPIYSGPRGLKAVIDSKPGKFGKEHAKRLQSDHSALNRSIKTRAKCDQYDIMLVTQVARALRHW